MGRRHPSHRVSGLVQRNAVRKTLRNILGIFQGKLAYSPRAKCTVCSHKSSGKPGSIDAVSCDPLILNFILLAPPLFVR